MVIPCLRQCRAFESYTARGSNVSRRLTQQKSL